MMDSRRDELLVQIAISLELLLLETPRVHVEGCIDQSGMVRQVGILRGARELFEEEKKARR